MMHLYQVLLLSLLLFHALTLSLSECLSGSHTVASLVREQFDKFVLLQRRGPTDRFLMPFYTAYIGALDAFVADRGFCPYAFGPCCLEQRDVDNFHAIHDRSAVDSKLANLLSLDPSLFYLPKEVISDQDMPALTSSQQFEVDILWNVTELALEVSPDSYVAVWSMLPEGLHMLYDPRQSETCSEFQKYKSSADPSKLVTSVSMIHTVTATALHARLLGVSEDSAIQILFHATAFIFNGIRCEKLQNQHLLVPTTFYPFYFARMNKLIAELGTSPASIPAIQPNIVSLYLGDTLRILSSYNSWGRIEHLSYAGLTTQKRNIKEDVFSPLRISQILGHMLDYTSMTDVERSNVQARKDEADAEFLTDFSSILDATWTMLTPMLVVYRQSVTCTEDLFHAYPVDPATALSGCCADLCDQTSLLQTLTPPLTKDECCTHCNEAECDVEDNPNNPLSALEEVHLIPYYEGGSEVVNL